MGLVNAEKADHLRIAGPGTLDGNGAAFWKAKTPTGRPRLCFSARFFRRDREQHAF